MWKTNPALLLCACREKCVCEKKDVKQWSTRLTVLTMLTKWTSVWPINVDGHPWVDVVVQRMTVTLDVNTGHPFGWPLGWLEVDLKLTFGWPSWSRSTRPHSSPLFVGKPYFRLLQPYFFKVATTLFKVVEKIRWLRLYLRLFKIRLLRLYLRWLKK